MKKVLIGCGIAMLLGGITIGIGGYWFFSRAMEMAGDMTEAIRTASTMSIDRMEQDATDIDSVDLGGKLTQLNNKPVRVTGKVAELTGAPNPGEKGAGPNPTLFLEPAVFVMATDANAVPKAVPAGTTVRVLGVASRLKMGAFPLGGDAKKEIEKQFGGTDVPLIVARKVELVDSGNGAAQ